MLNKRSVLKDNTSDVCPLTAIVALRALSLAISELLCSSSNSSSNSEIRASRRRFSSRRACLKTSTHTVSQHVHSAMITVQLREDMQLQGHTTLQVHLLLLSQSHGTGSPIPHKKLRCHDIALDSMRVRSIFRREVIIIHYTRFPFFRATDTYTNRHEEM